MARDRKDKDEEGEAGRLVLVLGDQLSRSVAALREADRARDVVLLAEVAEEAGYVRHHRKKIAFLFAAMRHFADALRQDGWTVDYVRLDDAGNSGSIAGEIARALKRHRCGLVLATEPGEWRLKSALADLREELDVELRMLDDDRFICPHDEFEAWAQGRKALRMEDFYREMRRKTGLLMNGDAPEGGRWNFDQENRKPPKDGLSFEQPPRFEPDGITRDVLDLVSREFEGHVGSLEPFWFAVTRDQALKALDHFIEHALPRFGDYQDAMLRDERFLYHSVLSPYMNAGLLDPREVCSRAEMAYAAGDVPLNAAEGFIRQIIGWREFVRGVYWLHMPGYTELNFFGNDRKLPDFYWTGETAMNCLHAAITETLEEAYAHHIQRLMVTGNFAMLAGIDPREVHEWYLEVYADAYEWVEAPNTIGMSQFADGGIIGSKPYAAGGNYINRMSDYCAGCRYDVKRKAGAEACPFNYLYWDFLARNRKRLGDYHRLRQPYSTWDRMSEDRRRQVRADAARFLSELE